MTVPQQYLIFGPPANPTILPSLLFHNLLTSINFSISSYTIRVNHRLKALGKLISPVVCRRILVSLHTVQYRWHTTATTFLYEWTKILVLQYNLVPKHSNEKIQADMTTPFFKVLIFHWFYTLVTHSELINCIFNHMKKIVSKTPCHGAQFVEAHQSINL